MFRIGLKSAQSENPAGFGCDIALPIVVASFMALIFLFPADLTHASGQSRRIVADPVSGYALYGYDPVAYFTEKKAIRGKRENEHVWRGVSWSFASRANREVFKADPEVYAPQYGGNGALAMARGYAAGCNPKVWAMYGGRLFLFYSYTARTAWAQSVDLHIQRADDNWITIEGTLAR